MIRPLRLQRRALSHFLRAGFVTLACALSLSSFACGAKPLPPAEPPVSEVVSDAGPSDAGASSSPPSAQTSKQDSVPHDAPPVGAPAGHQPGGPNSSSTCPAGHVHGVGGT